MTSNEFADLIIDLYNELIEVIRLKQKVRSLSWQWRMVV